MHALLVDADTGSALVHQEFRIGRVHRSASSPWTLAEVLVRGKTDAQGHFSLSRTLLFAGKSFSLEVEGYATLPFSRLRAKHAKRLEPIFAVRRAASLEIRRGEGSPLVGSVTAQISRWPVLQLDVEKKRHTSVAWKAVVSTPKRILFEDVPPGESIELAFFSGQKLPTSYGPPIVLSPGEHRVIDWDLHPGVEVHGTAHDSLGAPWTRSEVVLFQEQLREGVTKQLRTGMNRPNPNVSTATDEAGRFTFEGIQPGQYWVSVFKPGVVPDFRREAQLVTIPGDRTSHRLTLEFPRGLSLSGRVLSTARLGRGVVVRARSTSPELRASATVALDGESFKFDDLPRGAYELRAFPDASDKTRIASLPVIADSGERGVVLELRPGCQLSGQVVGGQGRFELYADPPVLYGPSFFDGPDWFRRDSNGSFHIPTLDPGSIRLCATQAPNLIGLSQPVHLQLGESKRGVEVQLEVGAALLVEQQLVPSAHRGTLTFEGF
ncbi:MAG: carboxypeptidase-like regulatory domain-containing protein [Planctomycetota bacterium]